MRRKYFQIKRDKSEKTMIGRIITTSDEPCQNRENVTLFEQIHLVVYSYERSCEKCLKKS